MKTHTLFIVFALLLSGCYQRTTVTRDRLPDALATCPDGKFDAALIRANTEIEVDPDAGMTSRTQWMNFCDGSWQEIVASSELTEFVLRRHVPGATYGLIIGVTLGTLLVISGITTLFLVNL